MSTNVTFVVPAKVESSEFVFVKLLKVNMNTHLKYGSILFEYSEAFLNCSSQQSRHVLLFLSFIILAEFSQKVESHLVIFLHHLSIHFGEYFNIRLYMDIPTQVCKVQVLQEGHKI